MYNCSLIKYIFAKYNLFHATLFYTTLSTTLPGVSIHALQFPNPHCLDFSFLETYNTDFIDLLADLTDSDNDAILHLFGIDLTDDDTDTTESYGIENEEKDHRVTVRGNDTTVSTTTSENSIEKQICVREGFLADLEDCSKFYRYVVIKSTL